MSQPTSKIINGDSLDALKELPDDFIDAVITDPPYGYSFMGKDWDKAVPSVDIWKECLRVLKPGGWCMVMSAPRSDVQNAMISRLMEAGFRLDFTPIYWTYASGFPKAGNVGKLVDKRAGRLGDGELKRQRLAQYIGKAVKEAGYNNQSLARVLGRSEKSAFIHHWTNGTYIPLYDELSKLQELITLPEHLMVIWQEVTEEAEREIVGKYKSDAGGLGGIRHGKKGGDVTVHATPQAKALDGSYTGFQPKPAVEVVIVAMKPLSEKTYVDQALTNRKGITWLDDCRVPLDGDSTERKATEYKDVTPVAGMNASKIRGSVDDKWKSGRFPANLLVSDQALNGHSKFFDLDAWADTLPFLAVPKASKSEKNKGLEDREEVTVGDGRKKPIDNAFQRGKTERKNSHPTVKPLKLMSYLITLTTRPGDKVLDPFVGSGTTAVAAKMLGRAGLGIEREPEYAEIARARLEAAEVEPEKPQEPEQTSLAV
jgi:DNA modification methylase